MNIKMGVRFFAVAYALLCFGMLAVQLHAKKPLDAAVFVYGAPLFAAGAALHAWLCRVRRGADRCLLPLSFLLTSVGLIMVYRLRPELFMAQLTWAAVGLALFLSAALSARRIRFLARYKYVVGLTALLLLAATMLFGSDIGGSRSWIILGPMRFQPSEFAKIAIVIFLAGYLAEHREALRDPVRRKLGFGLPPFRFIAPLVLIWGVSVATFVMQRDLGSALLFFGVALMMTYMATGRLGYIVMAGLFFLVSSAASYALFAHVRTRVAIWLHPWADPSGQAYQIVQSLFAFASGGLFGAGLGYGRPDLIPEAHTDFIFAAIAEELGLCGALAVLFAYLLLIYRGFRIALRCRETANMLLAAGLSAALAIQVFVILAGIVKLLPLTGITLPFVSYGGSSMAATHIMVGLLFSLSIKENNDA